MKNLLILTIVMASNITAASANPELMKLCKQSQKITFQKGELVGSYHGKWEHDSTSMNHTLLVLSRKNDKVTVLYAHGKWPKYGINNSNCSRHTGSVGVNGRGNPTITIEFNGNRTAVYNLYESGGKTKMVAQYTSSNGTTGGRLTKAE